MKLRPVALYLIFLLSVLTAKAQNIPTPKSHFGFDIGDDYQLANYSQTEAYFKKLATADDSRTRYVDIGLTEEGRHQFMMIISSVANIKQLQTYKSIAARLARAEGLSDADAQQLATKGKAVVWIDGGLHANETVGAHQLIQTAYTLLSRTDQETKRILDNNIVLLIHANPDGQEVISNWYMNQADPTKRNINIPHLYQKYIGHDNNRDFLMMNMKETQNITRQQYLEWFPQIVYNHHQSGPAGSVVAGPPFRDPFNYVYDPLLVTTLDGVGSAMNSRLNREGKPGYTQRAGTEFSTWWNGGLRTATYFHNMVGLLTEIVGNPTPSNIPLVPERLIPNSATPFPVTPQTWHFKQSIDYSVSLNYAVLNYAANNREDLLYNIYQMGKNSIERGSKDNWTLSPSKVEMINAAYKASAGTNTAGSSRTNGPVTIGGSSFGRAGMPVKFYDTVMHNPAFRDPRGYIISATQPDFATAVRFVNTGIRSGIIVHKATAAFTVSGKQYPAGSYIIKTNQAFRPWVLDMFEPQDHPNDFLYPGGPPIRPYDMTGWTLAYQMGVQFDRVLDDFNGPFERVPYGKLQALPVYPFAASNGGYNFSPAANNSFILVNELLKAGVSVYRFPQKNGYSKVKTDGTFYVPASATVNAILQKNKDLSVQVWPQTKVSIGKLIKLQPARIALWDNYGGSMASGWTRWLFEQYQFPFTVVYPQEFDAGNLKDKYDVIVFVGGAIPGVGRNSATGLNRPAAEVPAEFTKMIGRITADKTIPQLKAFLEAGGSIVTVGSSANLAYHLNLPVQNALLEPGSDRTLSGDKFYIPGAVLRTSVNTSQSATWGMPAEADVLYDNSPVFKLDSTRADIKPLLWFAADKPLRSGWAWGQQYLKNNATAFAAQVGRGNLYVFGPEITFRGMAHGTFKLLFNQLYVMKQ